MDQRVWAAVGVGGIAVAAVGAAWLTLGVPRSSVEPDAERARELASQMAERPVLPRFRSARSESNDPPVRSASTTYEVVPISVDEADEEPPEERRPGRRNGERRLAPDELAWARQTFREQRLEDMNLRLDDFASARGWNPELTEEVRAVLVDSIDGITERLLAIDRGEHDWHQSKKALRRYREAQAREVEALLGGEDFAEFADAMGFDRFGGEEPLPGRVRMRRGRRSKAPRVP